tara:strand:- start:404 stop:655 length:252 start_codon:yes stop_codon:yes gene_type:complete
MSTSEAVVDQVLDVKGKLCPIPIVLAYKTINQLESGQVLLVHSTDPGSNSDFKAWSEKTGNPILSITENEEKPKVFSYVIRKR